MLKEINLIALSLISTIMIRRCLAIKILLIQNIYVPPNQVFKHLALTIAACGQEADPSR